MNVVHLVKHKNRALVDGLRELLELAESGNITGLVFVVKFGQKDHRAGTLGDYRSHPDEALSATFQLERKLIKKSESFGRSI